MNPIELLKKEKIIEFIKNVDKKTWMVVMIGTVTAVLLWALLIQPAWFERPRLRHEIQTMDTQMRQFKELSQKRTVWENDEKIFSRLIQDTKARVYKEGESALLLGQVSKIAEAAHVEVIASKPRSEKVVFPEPYQERFQAINYDLTMRGGYHALGRLTEGIETQPKLLRIQVIQIVPVSDNPESQIAQFCLSAISEANASTADPGKKVEKTTNAAKR